jgi:hypothetical protein
MTNSENVDDQIRDASFEVYLPDLFLRVNQVSMVGSPSVSGTAMYEIPADASLTAQQGGQVTFNLAVKSITLSTFSIYGVLNNNIYTINTSIRVVGKSSGSVIDLPVTIASNS